MNPCPKPTRKKRVVRKRNLPLEKWPFKKLQKEADKYFSLYIRHRDNNSCVICGSKVNPQNGHLIKRGKQVLRYSALNCNCQCASCNVRHNYYPEYYTQWFINRYGVEEYNMLIAESGQVKKWRREELIQIIDFAKKSIEGRGI